MGQIGLIVYGRLASWHQMHAYVLTSSSFIAACLSESQWDIRKEEWKIPPYRRPPLCLINARKATGANPKIPPFFRGPSPVNLPFSHTSKVPRGGGTCAMTDILLECRRLRTVLRASLNYAFSALQRKTCANQMHCRFFQAGVTRRSTRSCTRRTAPPSGRPSST